MPNPEYVSQGGLYRDIQYEFNGAETCFRNLNATYDLAQQLSSIAIGSNAATGMTYDPFGLRIGRGGGLSGVFVYDGDELVFHQGAEGSTFYVWGPTGPIQEFTSTQVGNPGSISAFTPNTYTFDPNGNTVDRVDANGYLVDEPELYDAYGQNV